MPKANIKAKGRVVIRKNGVVIREGDNLIVTLGLALFARLITGSGTAPSHMAIGSDAQSPVIGDTDIVGTEHERVAASASYDGAGATWTATFGSGLGGQVTVAEAALFNAAMAGTMACRFVFDSFTMDNTDSLEISWAVTLS